MKSSLRWLHITDLHCGLSLGKPLWPTVKYEVFEDLKRVHARSGSIDLVLFTGDLTQRGTDDEFRSLEEELDELWDELAKLGSKPTLVCVPGNHDLARPNAKRPAVKAMRGWHGDAELRAEFWSESGCEYRAVVAEAFKAYDDFVTRFDAKHPLPAHFAVKRGELPGDRSVSFQKDDVRCCVVGLNSAFLQLDGGDYLGKLDLDTQQLSSVCGKNYPRWIKEHTLALLLTHHPSSWLHRRALDAFRGEIAPAGRFFAHLFGHMHEPRAATWRIGGADEQRDAQGASLLGLESWGDGTARRIHGYSVGGTDIDGERGDYLLWPRAARRLQSGGWNVTVDTSFKLDDERVLEHFIARPSAGVAPTPASPEPPLHAPAASPPAAAPPPPAATDALTLTNAQLEALVKALLAAFPSPPSLSRLTRFKLDLNLSAVATGNLHDQTFALVEWAETNGRLRDLIVGARDQNPGNPTLAAFARSVGVDVPDAPPSPLNVTPPPVTLTSDPAAISRELRAVLASLYDDPRDAIRLATDAGISRARVDFSGPAQIVWFNLLEEASRSSRVTALIEAARSEYPQHPALARLAQLSQSAPQAATGWSATTIYDSLVRLLPAQFEEIAFRLAIPSHFLPGTTAPLSDRANALVRICTQQGRLGEIVAELGRLGVRPARG